MNILGVSYNYHDAAACLARDGVPLAAAAEERFSREKHDASFPARAIAYCLRAGGINTAGLDGIAFYEKPARKLERVLQIAKSCTPQGSASLARQLPGLVEQGLNVEARLREALDYTGPIYFCEHHLAHAASAFYASPFQDAAILTVDGVGEWTTCAQFQGEGAVISPLREIHYPHSLGLLYSTLTTYLGFTVNNDEYKVMNFASYGKPRYRDRLNKLLIQAEDGSFALALPYFDFMQGNGAMHSEALVELLGPPRRTGGTVEPRHRDIAASLQALTGDVMTNLAWACRANQKSANLCLAGGVAYNCVANTQLAARSGFKRFFIQPAAGDDGAALGAALWASHAVAGVPHVPPPYHNTLLGPEFTEAEIAVALEEAGLAEAGLAALRLDEAELCARVALLLSRDMVVGWFQGRMEFGPRALGGRSILANPRNPDMKDILNVRVKFREEFLPFAPAVLEEAAADYFALEGTSPYMLLTPRVISRRKSEIPAVTHVDGTARVQTVSPVLQPLFHRLISAFGALTGTPVLINTSFNIRGEPIVCTPADAIRCFVATDIDFLALGPFLVSKV